MLRMSVAKNSSLQYTTSTTVAHVVDARYTAEYSGIFRGVTALFTSELGTFLVCLNEGGFRRIHRKRA